MKPHAVSLRRRLAAMACLPWLGGLTFGSHAGDGTIHFVGAIVAAPYRIAAVLQQQAPQPLRMKVTSMRGRQAELVFPREAVDRPSARVKIDTAATQAVSAHFMNSQGQAQAIDPAQWHPIGQHGGTLSLLASAAPLDGGPSAALVTVAYD